MNRRLRVTMVVVGFPHARQPDRGMHNLVAAQLLADDVDVQVIFLRAWKPGRPIARQSVEQGLPVLTLAVPQVPRATVLNLWLYRLLGWPLVRRALARCDLVYSVDASDAGVLAGYWCERAGLRHVAHAIGSDVNSVLPQLRGSRIVANWDRRVDAVVCESQPTANALRAIYPRVRNARIIYRGVNLSAFDPSGPVAGSLADRSPVRFLFLGGFQPYPTLPHTSNTKGGETLLAAWTAAEDDLAEAGASLLLAGPVTKIPRVERWRSSLKHPERVMIEGLLEPSSIPNYLRAADVLLIPSMEEGLPKVSMEASACGKAVFGSNVGGLPEVIAHGETGVILPAGDVDAWAKSLVFYARRPAEVQAMGERARERMIARFNRELFPREMLDVFRSALSGTPAENE